MIICDEVIESYEKEINFNEKIVSYKMHNFYISVAFLSITIVLLIAVSIYCYLINKTQITNDKLKEVAY